MSEQLSPSQHWPTQRGDLFHAEVFYSEQRNVWVLCQTTPACSWFQDHPTEPEVRAALAAFFDDHCLTPEARERQDQHHRLRLQEKIDELQAQLGRPYDWAGD